jgi:hypothetical protein
MTQPINHSLPNNQLVSIQQNSPLLEMPLDVILEIFKRLWPQDFLQVCQSTCQQWNQIFSDDMVWRNLLQNHFPYYRIPTEMRNFQKGYKLHNFNLTHGVYASHSLESVDRPPFLILGASEGKLFTCSKDNTIKIWDLNTNTCLATLAGHTEWVWAMAISDGMLFTGSDDSTIKIWDLNTKTSLATLTGHTASPYSALVGRTGGVFSLAVSDGKLFSGAEDCTIKIWDLNTKACIATLRGHKNTVTSLAVSNGELISGSSDGMLKFWNLNTRACIASLEGHLGEVTFLGFFGGELFSASADNMIKIWDLNRKTCLGTLAEHTGAIRFLDFFGGKLFSASADHKIKIWDLNTKSCLATIAGDTDRLLSNAVSEGKLYLQDSKGTIKILDFSAEHSAVFEEVANLLDSDSRKTIRQAMDRFSRMPKAARSKIYGELYKILKPLNLIRNDYLGCGEHAFHHLQGESSTPAQKAEAIRKADAHPLLQHLGIVSTQDYSEKLGCKPAHLQKIGLFSLDDIQLICSPSIDVQKLSKEVEVEESLNFRDNKVKATAHQRKKTLFDLSKLIAEAVKKKTEETNSCGVLIYPSENPWTSFQEKCQAFQVKLEGIVHECKDLPELTVEAFQVDKYNGLVEELNALVEELHLLDRDHQIAKLHAYVNQWGILTAWENRKAEGIESISQLGTDEQTLRNLFQMGE